MTKQVTWHLRMDREGRTCIARETRSQQGTMRGVLVEQVRMQERLEVEHISDVAMLRAFPIDLLNAREALGEVGTVVLKSAVQEYFIHAAMSGASRTAVALLAQICRPKQSLQSRIEANFTD